MAIPPGVGSREWETALRQFRQAVGESWVFTSDEDIALYRDAYSPLWGEPEERLVSAAVAPDTTEQVSAVVRTANQFRIPIYPISTGKNLGYGGSAPNLSGSVVIDLKRMNRVIEVDDKRHFAIVEPGVAYFDLYRYVQDRGLKVWLDCPDPGWGSPVGNALDHGVGYTFGAYRDHFHSHCGLEAVLPNGDIVRTGMGALPGAKTWAEYRYGFGPTVDGLFAQGNLGIVTRMGFHLLPAQEAYQNSVVTVPRRNDIVPLVDLVNELEHAGLIGMPVYGSPLAGPPSPELAELLKRPRGPSADDLDRFAQERKRGSWTCRLQFYGSPRVVAAHLEHAKERFASVVPGSTFQDGELLRFPLTQEQLDRVHKVAVGIPNMSIFSIGARTELNPSPSDGHLWFSPIIPKTGEAVLEAQRVFMAAFARLGRPSMVSPFSTPATWMHRAFIFIMAFPISRTNVAQNQRNREAFRELVRVAAEHGWGEYRTAPAFQDDVMAAYSFNNRALLRLHETIKDAVDPNGIVAGRTIRSLAETPAEVARMKRVLVATFACLAVSASGAFAQSDASAAQRQAAVNRGNEAYQYWCATCHGRGPGNPGTTALSAKYKKALPGALEDRTDLTAPAIRFNVRRGTSIMPFFRKTEISDADLEAIASYLTQRR